MSSPPSSSQYTGRSCSIWFQNQGPLHVSIDILNKCPKPVARLHSRSSSSGPLDQANIPEIAPETGHVIIHFLVTERYQCLKPSGTTEDERNRSELATAFWVYVRAGLLEIPSLQELAQSEMKRLVSKMNLVSVAQTLDGTGLSLERHPALEAHLANQIDLALTQSSKTCLNSLISELGVPRSVSMFFLEHILESQKSMLDTNGRNDEEASTDLTWVQFGKEFQALVQRFSRQDPIDEDLRFQPELQVMAMRESQEKSTLEALMSMSGKLDSTDQARLETLQRNSNLRAELLADCETDMAASKERVRQLSLHAQVIAKRMIEEQRDGSLLELRKAQHGFLSFKQLGSLISGKRSVQAVEEVSSQVTDESSDDGIMTPDADSVYESATETPRPVAKDEAIRPSHADSERIAKLRLQKDNKRLRRRLEERERISSQRTRGDLVILFLFCLLMSFGEKAYKAI
ncbi:uncharacterized protein FTOL_02698 [Fusarium torulosum]|uniref:Uncharacterized protein n=1 Tax=Fusarium torulosum TaxID=33205 RepID=A0AAE8M2H4_9HYPO|nr:uncharacterized protein FTOL_02698 [Fusarium torulosum]